LVKIVTVPFSETLGGFDDTPVQDFMVRHDVRRMEPQFFMKDGIPHWSFLFCYEPRAAVGTAALGGKNGRGRDSWSDKVPASRRALFDRLREWRNERGTKDGVPPYLVLTNRQLAAIVEADPDCPARLADIEGFGPKRVEKYGKDVLRILAAARGEVQDGGRGTDEGSGRGAEGADVLERVSGLVADDDGKVSEEGAVHGGEPD